MLDRWQIFKASSLVETWRKGESIDRATSTDTSRDNMFVELRCLLWGHLELCEIHICCVCVSGLCARKLIRKKTQVLLGPQKTTL